MKRFTISLDDDIAEKLEELMRERGYQNRSEAFRDMLRDIFASKQLARGDAQALAIVSYSYNHHKRQLSERINELQHERMDLVISTLHIHVTHETCAETIFIRGPMSEIESFALSIIAVPGVHYGKINLIPEGMESEEEPADHDHGEEHGHAHEHPHAHPHPHSHEHGNEES